jgi:multiphosphoryl transfer protein
MMQGVCNPVEFTFVCPLPNGLHARPASQLAELANAFASEFFLVNSRNGIGANLKSTLAIISADVRSGDECSLRVTGVDEEQARGALREYILRDLANSDEPLAQLGQERRRGSLPRALASRLSECHFGVAVSPGIGKGKSVILGMSLPPNLSAEKTDAPQIEERQIERALAALRVRIKAMLGRSMSPSEVGVLKAHLAIVEDVLFSEKIAESIRNGRSAGQAVLDSAQYFSALMQRSDSVYIRDRAVDIQEISLRLLHEIYGSRFTAPSVELNEPSIIVAETLAPQQLLGIERQWLKGLVLECAGTTSHAVILARSLGIPTIVGVKDAPMVLPANHDLVVDANRGFVLPNGTSTVKRFYQRESRALGARQAALIRNRSEQASTVDGCRIEVAANVSSREEVSLAFASGADAIGLFRTEMLFIGRDRVPSEEEQFAIYREAARAAAARPIIIRTIDIGGDKQVPHLNLPDEANPYLGYRGMRIYAEHRELFRCQLRAILRASAFGRIQIMAPMVSTIEEVLWFKEQIREVQNELKAHDVASDIAIRIGIMIEVPSVAFIVDQLCEEVDFFSIGTNDLNQYFLAVDRDNAKVAHLSNVRHPSFLRFLKHIVDGVHCGGKWIGMCGEMAGDVRNLPILIGLGLDEISASASQLPTLKGKISSLSAKECGQLLAQMINCTQLDNVERLLDDFHLPETNQSLLDPNLVIIESDSETKEEAIRELIDSLYVAGRTEDPDGLEEVVWERESMYSTGLGHGFAIPHCRSDAITANSVAILKLKNSLEWGSVDEKPVHMVLLLAIRESDPSNNHMQVLAKLARKLMNQEFRQQLARFEDARNILSYLSQELEIPL